MGGMGKCCCGCCGDLSIPSGWTSVSDCCAQCYQAISEEWTVECSAAIRTDNRSATGIYDYYARDIPVYEGETCVGELVCEINIGGGQTCYGDGGEQLPPCDETETLCTTITEVRTIDTVHKLVARYRRTGKQTTIARVQTQCDAEGAPTCKWVVISKIFVEVQWAQVAFVDQTHTINGTSSCCTDFSFSNPAVAPSCATRAAAGLSNTGTFAITRAKYYTSAPSGVITFNPGDTIDCTPLAGVCEEPGDDEIAIESTDPGLQSWTAPTCTATTENRSCQVHVHCINLLSIPPYDECGTALTEQFVYTLRGTTGDLLTNPIVVYECTFSCGTLPASTLATGYISRQECTLSPSPSRTDSGYTARTITIALAAWTVDLGGGCA